MFSCCFSPLALREAQARRAYEMLLFLIFLKIFLSDQCSSGLFCGWRGGLELVTRIHGQLIAGQLIAGQLIAWTHNRSDN